MKKRIISLALALLMVLALMPTLSSPANALTGHTQAEAVAWAQAQNGKPLDFDHVYGEQCVDLIKYYYQYLGNNEAYAHGNANEYAWNALPSGWTRVSSGFRPGDIAVFKTNYKDYNDNGSLILGTGSLGHVSIITAVNGAWFTSMNQNHAEHKYVEAKTFHTDAIQCAIRPDFLPSGPIKGIYYDYGIETFSNTELKVYTKIKMENATVQDLTAVGIVVYDNHNNIIVQKDENIDYSNTTYSYINIFYEIGTGRELNVTLNPGLTYKYQIYARIGSNTYYDEVRTFTTGGNGVYLNVDGLLNGAASSSLGSCGTMDVYIRGKQVANDVTEYYAPEHYGNSYEIKDIKAADGYTYKGVASGSLSGTISGSSVKVVLKFDTTAVSVQLDPNGGTVSPNQISVTPGGTYGTLPTPTRPGYDFDGWYTSADGGTLVTANSTVSSSVDCLFAHWVAAVCDGGANCPSAHFRDVDLTKYYHFAMDWAVTTGVTTGVTNTAFEPDRSCTRAQMVTFLWRAMGSPEPVLTSSPFVDVPANKYYTKAVLWALENNITTGVDSTHFMPDRIVNRAQTVTFLWRMKGQPSVSGTTSFSDVPTNAYYARAVAWAAKNGVTTGYANGTFRPDTECSRAQIVTFLYRAITG